jgi:uncharacterized protein YjbI with pentapeptide repeats
MSQLIHRCNLAVVAVSSALALAAVCAFGFLLAVASAEVTLKGCRLVANPTPQRHTHCHGDLGGVRAPGVNLSYADLRDAVMTHADLAGARLVDAALDGIHLGESNLERADLSGATLFRAHLIGARLRDADLTRAHLRDADLTHADLTGAKLFHARMIDADLSYARLFVVYLVEADLTGARLIKADVRAYMTGANLTNANLSGANPFDVIYGSPTFCHTTMPNGSVNNGGCK